MLRHCDEQREDIETRVARIELLESSGVNYRGTIAKMEEEMARLRDKVSKAEERQANFQDTVDERNQQLEVAQDKLNRTIEVIGVLRTKLKNYGNIEARHEQDREKMQQQLFIDMQEVIEVQFDTAVKTAIAEHDMRQLKTMNEHARLKAEMIDQKDTLALLKERCEVLESRNRKLTDINTDLHLQLRRRETDIATRENRMNLLRRDFDDQTHAMEEAVKPLKSKIKRLNQAVEEEELSKNRVAASWLHTQNELNVHQKDIQQLRHEIHRLEVR